MQYIKSPSVILVGVFLSGIAIAKPDRDKVELLLSSREHIPSKNELLQLGTDVEVVLREIVANTTSRPFARNRAISLLSYFPSKETSQLLLFVIEKNKNGGRGIERVNLQQALISYAKVVGPQSLTTVKPFLEHSNLDVRYSAVKAVRFSRNIRAKALLEEKLTKEPSEIVRHQIKRELELFSSRQRNQQ